MDAAQQKLIDDMNEAYQARYEACKKYKELCQAFVDSTKDKPEKIGNWEWLNIKRCADAAEDKNINFSVKHVVFEEYSPLREQPLLNINNIKQGDYVAVKPCSDEKTYLGVMLGDLCEPVLGYNTSIETLYLKRGMGNPAMWVFDLNKVVMGYESWWNKIEKPEDLKQITDTDIDNVWYVKALKDLSKEE
ncbi:hypothetical protein [Zooshikella sp. RANM57]|uniref:hypothetical protein n=1 Tax=Zooshikella sp. RANM57 TaxID=3425863 RepID=UPI003D700979